METNDRDRARDSWELQMALIEDEQKREVRRLRLGWIACGLSVGVTALFALWVFSLT